MTEDIRTFEIPVVRWDDFVAKFAKLNRRAAKLGCEPCTFAVVGEAVVKRTVVYKYEGEEHSREHDVPVRLVTVAGAAPRLADWALVARVEELAEGLILIHSVPGVEGRVDPRFRSLGAHVCEHCRKARRRRDVFVVRHADGRELQVGRQCLADFTGINSPERAAAQATWLCMVSDLVEDGGWFSGLGADHVPVLEALELTSAYIRAYGWQSRSAANNGGDRATADLVADHFAWTSVVRSEAKTRLVKLGGLTDDDTRRAGETIRWVEQDLAAKEGRSDYEENLVQLVLHDLASTRHLGIVCSALATALRVKSAWELRKAKEAELLKSVHVGAQGERLRGVQARVLSVRSKGGDFGASTLVKLVTADGNVLTWWASGDVDVEPGAEVTLDGTVKRHGEYNGVKETQLTRVKAEGLEIHRSSRRYW
ncbi:MAG TPA: hypothetical protein PKN52_00065 [Trueperaceae bacterium]|nr:hypothetical protein [Trueperaceae bacterium]